MSNLQKNNMIIDEFIDSADESINQQLNSKQKIIKSTITCRCCFDSQLANIAKYDKDYNIIIEQLNVTIIEYLANDNLQKEIENEDKILVCEELKEMEFVKSSYRCKAYFRHSNHNSNQMTKWHLDWQESFDLKFREISIGNRRADICIDNIVVEFQYSRITKELVDNRLNNYKSHNKQLIWLIDGSESVECMLGLNNKYILTFKTLFWKFESFTSNDIIFIEIKNQIFKIKPNHVKSNMISPLNVIDKLTFIDLITTNNLLSLIGNIEDDDDKSTLYYNQRGAGCGKTYESIQLLQNIDFSNKSKFIYLTKMHSAKEVIFNEIKSQLANSKLSNLDFEFTDSNELCDLSSKHYVIDYTNTLTNENCQIIIGTIDSFMYSIKTNVKIINKDYFEGITKSIRDGNIKTGKSGQISFANAGVKLNKKCLLIIDETQDLGPEYIEACSTIIELTAIDAYIIGDKLQSIWGPINVYTFMENNNLKVNTIRSDQVNNVKRFHNIQFKDFVNHVIDFSKYNLPSIENICDGNCNYKHTDEIIPYKLFQIENIYENTNEDTINQTIEQIINYVDSEVCANNYLPNNFMFIFPILKKNVLANFLEAGLQKYWINKFNDLTYQIDVLTNHPYWSNKIGNNQYYKYVYFHKSDEGKSINLTESENATRILSIHASKGNGAEVVFVLGITENTLCKFSKIKCNIQYDSLLHVAITRQKKSLYMSLVSNGDDIWNRFRQFNIELNPNISPNIDDNKKFNKIEDIKDFALENTDHFTNINKIIQQHKFKYENNEKTDENKQIIDMSHHMIRKYVFYYNFIFNLINTGDHVKEGDQIKETLRNISKLPYIEKYSYTEYNKQLYKINDNNNRQEYVKNNFFPILNFETDIQSKYSKYTEIIKKFVENIQIKLKKELYKQKIPILCPLESIILIHIMEIIKKGKYVEISIMDIYSILYAYDECTIEFDEYHNKCLCKKIFIKDNNNLDLKKYADIRSSIISHHSQITKIEIIFQNYIQHIKTKYQITKCNYNIMHMIWYNNKEAEYSIRESYQIIANSNKYVIHFQIKPQFNMLNFNEIMFDAIFANFFLQNIDEENNNNEKFGGKKIISCVISLDFEKPVFYEFNIDKNDIVVKNCIRDYLITKYESNHEIIYEKFLYESDKNKIKKENDALIMYNGIQAKDKLPRYIKDYYHDIGKKIEINDDQMKDPDYSEILEKLQNRKKSLTDKIYNKDVFLIEIKNKLVESINKFLNIVEPQIIQS